MTKYDNLDARTELEQTIAVDFSKALKKRDYDVKHNGSKNNSAPGGITDIQAGSNNIIINIEVTKLKKSSQDREFQSIRDHLIKTKEENQKHKCFCLFISPETSQRTIDSIKDYNNQRERDGKLDMRIMPLDFFTCEILTKKLTESEASVYDFNNFIKCFSEHKSFIDDLRIRKLIAYNFFPDDEKLCNEVRIQETEHDEKTLEQLIKDLTKIENYMRENGIATGSHAIENLIFLVFLKLYEEKREKDKGILNRLRSVERFETYRQDQSEELIRKQRCIHHLFETIKSDNEFRQSMLFTGFDKLRDEVDDKFLADYILPIFEDYNFYGTKLDALGAVYEVLALRAEKDIKVGQFFTPENVVKFMVDLADLFYTDKVLDPACGTGRFLIHAMYEMQYKLKRSDARNKEDLDQKIRKHQCFGADIDTRIAKIAKMNMWIHGDGKSNIFGGKDYNGLLLHKKGFNGKKTFDNNFDVILTNPPLGELNYQTIKLTENKPDEQKLIKDKLTRIPVLPHKNLTQKRLKNKYEALAKHKNDLMELERQKTDKSHSDRELQTLAGKIKRKIDVIRRNQEHVKELDAKLKTGKAEFEITGNNMKGGAMFLTAIWHYLKSVSNMEELPEWKGGKALVILDEGVLNTEDYKEVRNYIRRYFYIKAVISLTRDTFMPISKTSTKTSILYVIKKSDFDAVQKEPIFFAHAEQVGLDRVGKVCKNSLPEIANSYIKFKETVKSCYSGKIFNQSIFHELANNGKF